jgi:uncharacterized protein YjiS (DUF1127 family)
MTYASINQHQTHETSFGKHAIAVLDRLSKDAATAIRSARQKWEHHKSVAEFSGMNDHALRGIGIHRSEVTSITNQGVDLSRARFYR